LPKQIKANGLKDAEINIGKDAIRDIIRYYTRESGVRSLERELAKICRKVIKEIALAGPQKLLKSKLSNASKDGKKINTKTPALKKVNSANLEHYLGVRRFDFGRAEEQSEVGLVTGLAWTEVGGELLQIEATLMPGKGQLILTGQLGDVMQESAKAAYTVVRSRSLELGLDVEFHNTYDIHVHVPEGATPKDGPSAGVAMVTAFVSALSKVPVRADLAMTGEITLRGRVLPIGGLKEKLLAALRGGIKTVLIPEENRKDLADIPANVTKDLEIIPVKWIDQVLDLALVKPILESKKTTAVKKKVLKSRVKQSPSVSRTH
jgi:ATP-dependent Lon protease